MSSIQLIYDQTKIDDRQLSDITTPTKKPKLTIKRTFHPKTTTQKTNAYAKHILIFAKANYKTLNIELAKKKKSLSYQPHSYIVTQESYSTVR